MGNDRFGIIKTVLSREAVLFSEGPLSEVPYDRTIINDIPSEENFLSGLI